MPKVTITGIKKRTSASDKSAVSPIHKTKDGPAAVAMQGVNYGKPVHK